MEWIQLVQDKVQYWVTAKTILKLRVLNGELFLVWHNEHHRKKDSYQWSSETQTYISDDDATKLEVGYRRRVGCPILRKTATGVMKVYPTVHESQLSR